MLQTAQMAVPLQMMEGDPVDSPAPVPMDPISDPPAPIPPASSPVDAPGGPVTITPE